jgi:hypothetical protein
VEQRVVLLESTSEVVVDYSVVAVVDLLDLRAVSTPVVAVVLLPIKIISQFPQELHIL